ncbi:MAG: sodium:proton antiporter [Chlorobiaceae bacterium]
MSKILFSVEHHKTAVATAVLFLQSPHQLPSVWLIAPFLLLLLMIATGSLFYPRFWERYYTRISVGLGAVVVSYYGFAIANGYNILLHTLEEYISFLTLISALFVVAGGILIKIEREGTPLINGALLLSGALFANLIGTTGASMLLIRPYMRINKGRIKPFHIVFFIFIVSNIGGGLTPVGDPPLFLGFLKGVPFFWVVSKLWLPWLITIVTLLLVFMVCDFMAGKSLIKHQELNGGLSVVGAKNFIFLALIIVAVFLDPAVIPGFPSLQKILHLPFGIRELLMFVIAVFAYKTADKKVLQGNEFNFLPIKEVAFLFMGIFATMIPVLELVGAYAANHVEDFSVTRFYWMTGILSGLLDNAPTYLNFLAAALGKFGRDIGSVSDIRAFAAGLNSPVQGDVPSTIYLMAISLASVFFGALTYIGNAPNFMVKHIAEQAEIDMPDFIEYLCKYSLPVLVPIFVVLWCLFFRAK